MKGVHILDVLAKNSGLYQVPKLRYAWFCCLTPQNSYFLLSVLDETAVRGASPPFWAMKPTPFIQKFCATLKIYKNLCCSSKNVDFTAFSLNFSLHEYMPFLAKKCHLRFWLRGGGYFEDRTIPKVSSDFLWPKEQHLGVPKFLFWVLKIVISPTI